MIQKQLKTWLAQIRYEHQHTLKVYFSMGYMSWVFKSSLPSSLSLPISMLHLLRNNCLSFFFLFYTAHLLFVSLWSLTLLTSAFPPFLVSISSAPFSFFFFFFIFSLSTQFLFNPISPSENTARIVESSDEYDALHDLLANELALKQSKNAADGAQTLPIRKSLNQYWVKCVSNIPAMWRSAHPCKKTWLHGDVHLDSTTAMERSL